MRRTIGGDINLQSIGLAGSVVADPAAPVWIGNKQKENEMNAEMREKLIKNERPLFVLIRDDPEMVEAFKKLKESDIECREDGAWRIARFFDIKPDDFVYRLRPDYVEPVEPRHFVYVAQDKRNGGLVTHKKTDDTHYINSHAEDWLELKTAEELEYVKARPEGCRFGLPEIGETIISDEGTELVLNGAYNTKFLTGYRWIKDEPKEQDIAWTKELETLVHEMFVEAEKKFNDVIRTRATAIDSPISVSPRGIKK